MDAASLFSKMANDKEFLAKFTQFLGQQGKTKCAFRNQFILISQTMIGNEHLQAGAYTQAQALPALNLTCF